MIARYWKGRIRARDVDAYVAYVRRTGIAAQRATPGNLGSIMLVRREEGEAEVVVLSLWDSMDAVRRFAGASEGTAVFYPEDDRYLIAADTTTSHFDVPAYSIDKAGLGGAAVTRPPSPRRRPRAASRASGDRRGMLVL